MNPTSLARAIRRILLELKSSHVHGIHARRRWVPSLPLWWVRPGYGHAARRWRSRWATWPNEAAGDLETVPGLIAIAFYIIGAAIVGFGLLKLKRHVDHPQQTTIGSGLIAILIGVALIAAPAVINALGATFGVDGGSHTVLKPRL